MQDLNDKINNGGATSQGQLSADEWNQIPSEIQNVIEGTGQVLSAGDLNQLGKSIADYSANSTFYTDGGIANAYVLTSIGLKESLTAYTDGSLVQFVASNDNTGSSTINVSGLGVTPLRTTNGDELAPGVVVAGDIISAIYKSSPGEFQIIRLLNENVFIETKSGRKNLVINGDFGDKCWRRGTVFTSTGAIYTAERWLVFASGGNTDVDQVGSTIFTGFEENVGFGLRIKPLAGSTQCPIETRLESSDVFSLENGTATLQFIVDSNEAIDLDLEIRTPTVIDDWASSVIEQTTTKSISASTQLVTHTFTGLSSEVRKGLSVLIRPVGYTAGVLELSVTNVQLEQGSVATNFDRISAGQSLSLCNRYGRPADMVSGSVVALFAGDTMIRTSCVAFPSDMRTAPSLDTTGLVATVQNIATTSIGTVSVVSYIGSDTQMRYELTGVAFGGAENVAISGGFLSAEL